MQENHVIHSIRNSMVGVTFVIAVCVFGESGTAASDGTIKGRILDRKTGDPLQYVNVVVRGTNTGAATNEDGEFEVRLVPGTYTVVASLIGHATQEVTGVTVQTGEVTFVEIVLAEAAVQIGDVTVFGASLRNERITDAPASVSVLSAEDIKLNSVSGQVPLLLETQPGVDIVQNGLNDFNVNVRGFNSSLNRRLLVLLDGRDLAVAFLGSQEWNGLSLPVEDLGRMELVRGPGSALYGANAFNGVINILTPRPRDIQGTKITVAGGERSTLRSDVRFADVAGPWAYRVNAGRFQGDSWSVSRMAFPFEYSGFNPFLNTEVTPVGAGKVASTYGSARVDYDSEDEHTTTVEAGITQVENEILVTGIGRVQVPKAVKPWGRASFSTQNLHVQAWGAGRNSLRPQVSLSTGLPLEERSFIGQLDVQYRVGLLEDRLFLITGAAHRYQFVDTDGTLTLTAHRDNLSGVYAQVEYQFIEELKSVFAARWDRSTLHASQISPKAAIVWTPFRSHSLRATFNRAFQAPNYSELFLYVKHPIRNLAYFGNDNLVVEKITGYEVGYKGIFGNSVFVTVDGYYNQLKDFITDLAPSVNPKYPGRVQLPGESFERTIWSYGNAGEVNEFGMEVSANIYPVDEIQLSVNYALFDFDVQSRDSNDVLLPNAPKHKVNAGIVYRKDRSQAGLSFKHVPTFDWAAGIYKGTILSYSLFNFSGSYRLTEQFELGLNVTNLFDKRHYQIFGGSLIGRRATASVTAYL